MNIFVRVVPTEEGHRIDVLRENAASSQVAGTYIHKPDNGKVRQIARHYADSADQIVLVGPEWRPPWLKVWP